MYQVSSARHRRLVSAALTFAMGCGFAIAASPAPAAAGDLEVPDIDDTVGTIVIQKRKNPATGTFGNGEKIESDVPGAPHAGVQFRACYVDRYYYGEGIYWDIAEEYGDPDDSEGYWWDNVANYIDEFNSNVAIVKGYPGSISGPIYSPILVYPALGFNESKCITGTTNENGLLVFGDGTHGDPGLDLGLWYIEETVPEDENGFPTFIGSNGFLVTLPFMGSDGDWIPAAAPGLDYYVNYDDGEGEPSWYAVSQAGYTVFVYPKNFTTTNVTKVAHTRTYTDGSGVSHAYNTHTTGDRIGFTVTTQIPYKMDSNGKLDVSRLDFFDVLGEGLYYPINIWGEDPDNYDYDSGSEQHESYPDLVTWSVVVGVGHECEHKLLDGSEFWAEFDRTYSTYSAGIPRAHALWLHFDNRGALLGDEYHEACPPGAIVQIDYEAIVDTIGADSLSQVGNEQYAKGDDPKFQNTATVYWDNVPFVAESQLHFGGIHIFKVELVDENELDDGDWGPLIQPANSANGALFEIYADLGNKDSASPVLGAAPINAYNLAGNGSRSISFNTGTDGVTGIQGLLVDRENPNCWIDNEEWGSEQEVAYYVASSAVGTKAAMPGTAYWLKEAKSPSGYQYNPNPIHVCVAEGIVHGSTWRGQIWDSEEETWVWDDPSWSADDWIIRNKPGNFIGIQLPFTGDNGVQIHNILGLLIIMAAFAGFAIQTKREYGATAA